MSVGQSRAPVLTGRWSLSGYAFSNWSPQALLDRLVEWGIGAIDYWPWNSGGAGAGAFAELARDRGLELACLNVPPAFGRLLVPGEEVAATEAIMGAILEGREIGTRYVQVYPGVPLDKDAGAAIERLATQLKPLLSAASDLGIVLLIENNLDQRGEDLDAINPSRRPESLSTLVELVGSSSLRLTFDPCNFYTTGTEAYPAAYRLLKPYMVNVHIKDCVRYSPAAHATAPMRGKLLIDSHVGAHLPTPVGQGSIPWRSIFDALSNDRYEGWFTLDPFVEEPRLVDWCDQSLSWLRAEYRVG